MKLIAIIPTLALAATSAFAQAAVNYVTYDQTYDNSNGSLGGVACSNGDNGLLTKGFTTFGSLPAFPYIGGVPSVRGWNSKNCGSCWNLEYKGKTISVLAVDTAFTFNIGRRAMDNLTQGKASELGKVEVNVTPANPKDCGL